MTMPVRVKLDSCSAFTMASNNGTISGIEIVTATAERIMPVSPRRLNAGVTSTMPSARATPTAAAAIIG